MVTLARLLMVALPAWSLVPLCGQANGAKPVAEVAKVQFHSDELMNLHHVLYAAAWAERTKAKPGRMLAGRLASPLEASFSDEERAAWDRAVQYYGRTMIDRDLLRGEGMVALKTALVEGKLDDPRVDKELRAVLAGAAPVYRKYFWPAHDRVNREYIRVTTDRAKSIAPEVIGRLEKLYQTKWFTVPVRADVVWVGSWSGGYTTTDPAHATISSTDAGSQGWNAVETIFHEYSHELVLGLENKLNAGLGDAVDKNRDLWHAIQFYLTGVTVRDALKAKGIEYSPYVYAGGMFERAWPQYRVPIETNWDPYVAGKSTMEEAIAGTVRAVAAAQ